MVPVGASAIRLATYSATDHEDTTAALRWSLSGTHADKVVICEAGEADVTNCDIENITGAESDGASTVDLVLNELPDYEDPATSNNSFAVKLTVTDRTRPTALTASKDVTIKVINVNEDGSVTVSHTQPEVNASITASLEDPDVVSGSVKWRWHYASAPIGEITGSRGGSASFTPISRTGSNPLDEEGRLLRVVASYTDRHGSGKTAEFTFADSVQAEDADNLAPVFKLGGATTTTPLELTFREDATPTVLGLVAAGITVEDDSGDDLIYKLDKVHDYALFTVPTRTTADIGRAEGTTFNYDSNKKKYELDLRVTDPSGDSDVLVVIVNVTDFQEKPRVPDAGRAVNYPEIKNSVPNMDSVYKYTATDDDDKRIGRGRQLTWRISEDPADNAHSAFFDLTERGVLSFKSPPDFETIDSSAPTNDVYLVKLRVTDNGDANGADVKSTEVPVQVTVENVDEPGTVTFGRLQPLEKEALTATLADEDGITQTATTTWKWERSDDGSRGWTTATTTDLAPAANNNVYTYTPVADDVDKFLRVTVSYRDAEDPDPLNPAKMSEPKVTANAVARNLVNDEPFFVYTADDDIPEGADEEVGDKIPDDTDTATVVRKIAENSPEDTTIGEPIQADDEDRDTNNNKDILTYAFDTNAGDNAKADAVTVTVPDANGATFDIDRATGQISVGASSELNYEAAPNTYDVTVTATDPSGAFDEIGVQIRVTNVEENPSIEGAAEISLTEVINPDAVTPAATTTIDEAVLAIEAVNVDGSTEDPRRALHVDTYTATDDEDDAGTREAGALKWTLAGTDVDRFILFGESSNAGLRITDDVDASGIEDIISSDDATSTVQLLLKELPDYENPANSSNTYSVTLIVTDTTHPEGLTDTLDVTVRVTNVDEEGTVKLLNRQPEVGVPIQAELADPDGGVTIVGWQWATADLSLSEGARVTEANIGAATWTNITGATSDTYTPVSGDATKLLAAVATYKDAANEDDPFTHDMDESEVMSTSTADYTVKGADSNNQAPVFPDQDENTPGDQSDRATRSILESAGAPDPVGDPIPARDTDGSGGTDVDVLTYTLGGPDAALFSIDEVDPDATPATVDGQIRVGEGTKFDFETKSTYTVTVTATDPVSRQRHDHCDNKHPGRERSAGRRDGGAAANKGRHKSHHRQRTRLGM